MQPDPARIADTKAWLAKAAYDLRSAEVARSADPPLLADVVFHCQQAVEKALKALLSWHDTPFRKTHNLLELGKATAELEPSLDELLRRAAPLTEYATAFRYPGDVFEPPPEDVDEAHSLARDVFQAALDRLPQDTHP